IARIEGCAMGQVLHGSATTTEAIRQAIQHSKESLRALSRSWTDGRDQKDRDRRWLSIEGCRSRKSRSSLPSAGIRAAASLLGPIRERIVPHARGAALRNP